MASPRAGVSGVAVTMIGFGALLVWSAVHDVPVLDALRALARGQVPAIPAKEAALPTTPGVQGHSGFAPDAGAGQGANGSGGGGGSW